MKQHPFRPFAILALSVSVAVGMTLTCGMPAFAADGHQPDVVAQEITAAAAQAGGPAQAIQGKRTAGSVRSADGHQAFSTGAGASTLTATNNQGDTLTVDLPTLPSAASVATDGSVVYAASKGDVAGQVLSDGTVRVATTMPSADAPADFAYQTHLPAGAQIRSDGKGGLDFVKANPTTNKELTQLVLLGHMDAPWAVDANGKSVPTAYEVAGSRITQHVQVSSTTAFPVVADPHIYWPYWYMPEIMFTYYETGQVRNPMVLWALAGTICALVAAETLGIGCAAFAAEAGAISAIASNAYGDKRCLALRYGVVPYSVSCTTGQ